MSSRLLPRSVRVIAAGLLVPLAAPPALRAGEPPPDTGPQAREHPAIIIVVGAPGTEEYGAEFERTAALWVETARGVASDVLRIGPGETSTGHDGEDTDEATDRARLEKAIAARKGPASSRLWIVLIGHGTFNGQKANFNLVGPDVSSTELAAWLEDAARPLAIINCASASGPYINHLSGPDRVIVTATRSGYEYDFARFGGYLADVIAAQDTDLDKDEQVSLLEAFLAAASRVAEFYESEARLATEHALIDDNGDGLGTPPDWFRGIRAIRKASDDAALDGVKANQVFLVPRPAERDMPPDVRAKRDDLELAISELREEKPALDEDDYYERLEPLVLELARLYASLEESENEKAGPPAPPDEANPDEAKPAPPAPAPEAGTPAGE